jgi:hypothetical protein
MSLCHSISDLLFLSLFLVPVQSAVTITTTTTTTRPLYEYERQFVICESCLWCATVFQKTDIHGSNNYSLQQQQIYPICKNKSISLIPLAKDEGYTIAIEGKRGPEIEFSKRPR